MRRLIIAAVLLIPAVALAVPVLLTKEDAVTKIDGLAINTDRWTGWVNVKAARSLTVEITLTRSASTAVTMRCESSDSSSTANDAGADIHKLSDSSTAGTSDSVTHTWSNAVAGNETWTWTVANLPQNHVNCLVRGTSADGSDTVVVKVKAVYP